MPERMTLNNRSQPRATISWREAWEASRIGSERGLKLRARWAPLTVFGLEKLFILF